MSGKNLRKYKIPVTWEMFGLIEVEAESVEQAIKMMNRDEDRDGNEFLFPQEQEYSEGSFMVTEGYAAQEILASFAVNPLALAMGI
jgi:hypothetical protein